MECSLTASWQKIVGMQIKDQDYKQKSTEEAIYFSCSTLHIAKYYEKPTMDLDFSKFWRKPIKLSSVKSTVSEAINVLPTMSKVSALNSSMSPATKSSFVKNILSSGGVTIGYTIL